MSKQKPTRSAGDIGNTTTGWAQQFDKAFTAQVENEAGSWFPGSADLIVHDGNVGPIYGASDVLAESLLGLVAPRLLEECGACESPIEEAMFAGLVCAALQMTDGVSCGTLSIGSQDGPDTLIIEPQHKIGRFRTDFKVTLLERWGYGPENCAERSALVECDGHDYHERTKQQAKRDKSRDRQLQALGHHVLRFTGSEIWGDPLATASEIVQHLLDAHAARRQGGNV